MEPLSLAVGAALFVAGMLAGRLARTRRPPPKGPDPICMCGDSLAMHDRQTNECHAQKEREIYVPGRYVPGNEYIRCPCRQYVGPVPLAEVWTPKIITGNE